MSKQGMKEPLLEQPSAPTLDEAAGSRPPPFAPGSGAPQPSAPSWEAEQDVETAKVKGFAPVDVPAASGFAQAPAPARGGDGVVHVHVHHVHHVPADQESICCPLMIFILGFSFPTLWLFGCCYIRSRNPTIRLLGKASIIAFGISMFTGVIIIFQIWARSGKWPWEK
mmetsp:Transcript_19786/g.40359  ORF Transcript_19786/g.40359 Transcript_19786/m.40359 type:complete len:168 (-) Transcript_19786:84-587(-)|eukprot:CAMPEP_0181298260 /NCGR_PEP_ID=MMETSP1101-20121128/5687_1 /TAXON_ID=46948 /ORGANISM="Rhodomonas abbreviata, Strain Caron Lab Isolate" /LENGTH=167 /DNA_ID=CAMNT_0023403269 /DNA_START=109 /DNA_END=612 /DNA_ORIENTATION=+